MTGFGGDEHRTARAVISRFGTRKPKGKVPRSAFRLILVTLLLLTLVFLGQTLAAMLETTDLEIHTETAMHFALLVFVVAAATPFVPGAEIGLALLMIMGRDAAFEVYFAMLAALLLAFTAGRLVPAKIVSGLRTKADSRWRLLRLRSLRCRPWSPSAVMTRAHDFLAANRHVALGAVLNMPGNSILGGGGGIALLAGASRQYSYLGFCATIAIAALPLPLVFLVLG